MTEKEAVAIISNWYAKLKSKREMIDKIKAEMTITITANEVNLSELPVVIKPQNTISKLKDIGKVSTPSFKI